MSLSIPNALTGLSGHRAKFRAKLWHITRRDGTQFRFTTSGSTIRYNDGTGLQDFVPGGAPSGSAERREEGLKDQEKDAFGAITSAALTYADFEAGLFREAEIVEYEIDPRFPWAGSYNTSRYWITDTEFDGEQWQARLMGSTSWLSGSIGRIFGRNCGADLFSTRCGKLTSDETWYEISGVRPEPGSYDATEPRRKFALVFGDIPNSGPEEDEYKHGKLTCTAGANAGLVSEIKYYAHTATGGQRDIELHLPTPYPIADTDEFTIQTGCSRQHSVCVSKFANAANFRGYPFMPGTDDLYQTPDSPA